MMNCILGNGTLPFVHYCNLGFSEVDHSLGVHAFDNQCNKVAKRVEPFKATFLPSARKLFTAGPSPKRL